MACVYTKQFSNDLSEFEKFLINKGWKEVEDDKGNWIKGNSVICIGKDGIPGCLSSDVLADNTINEWNKSRGTKQFSAWDEGVFEERLEDLIYEYSQEEKGVDIKTMVKILKYYASNDNLTSYIEMRREKENG